jgi:beta-galactosidase GanA
MKTFLFIISIVLSYLLYRTNNDVKYYKVKYDSLLNENDSLRMANFINETNATRYEIARDNLYTENKHCGEQFDYYLSRTE